MWLCKFALKVKKEPVCWGDRQALVVANIIAYVK